MLTAGQHTFIEFIVATFAWFIGLGIGFGMLFFITVINEAMPVSINPIVVGILMFVLFVGSCFGCLFLALGLMAKIPAKCKQCGGKAWVTQKPERKTWQCEKCGHLMISGWRPSDSHGKT